MDKYCDKEKAFTRKKISGVTEMNTARDTQTHEKKGLPDVSKIQNQANKNKI